MVEPAAVPTDAPEGNGEQQEAVLREIVEALSTPSGYMTLRLGMSLYDWQMLCSDALEERRTRAALRTCNESGKTSTVISGVILWHMETFRDSLTVTTAGVFRQVTGQLYPHLKAFGSKLGKEWEFGDGWGRNTKTGARLISFSTDNAGLAEGWHEPPRVESPFDPNENPLEAWGCTAETWGSIQDAADKTSLLVVADEAKSIKRGIFEAFERCRPTRYLVASSPGEATGPFFDCFHSDKKRWQTFHAAAWDCPHLWEDSARRREIEEQLESLPKPFTDSAIGGEFPDQADFQIFNMEKVEKAMAGILPRWGQGRRRAALDVSGGGDEQVLFLSDGNEAWIGGVWHETDDHRLVSNVIEILQRNSIAAEWFYADNGGLGQIVLNEFERRGWAINRVDFGGKAKNDRLYANWRAEAYMLLADRIKRGEIRLPKDDTLRDQLSWQKYVFADGPIRLIPKNKLPHSPDRSDSLVMLFYDLPQLDELVRIDRQKQRHHSMTMTVSDDSGYQTGGVFG